MEATREIIPGYPIDKFVQDGQDRGWLPETCRNYRHTLCELAAYLQNAGQLSPQTLAGWLEQLHRQGYRQRSINIRISAANNYFRWCSRPDLLMHHGRPPDDAAPELTRPEYLRLLRAARAQHKHRLYLLIKLFAAANLPVQCLDQVTVQLVQHGGGTLDCRGSPQAFAIPAALCRELLDYIAENGIPDGPVFVTRSGRPVNRSNLCRDLQALCREAHVPEEKGNPRALRSLYQATQDNICANLEQLLQQAYNQLLEAEQVTAGWKEGA